MKKGAGYLLYFVDLPNEDERRAIISIHLNKRKRAVENYDIDSIVKDSEGYSGAEIEEIVESALSNAFEDDMREMTTQDVLDAIKDSIPLSISRKEQIVNLRLWANERARNASTQKELVTVPESPNRRVIQSN
ncbi:hypothetical protein [Brevibacillus reuszeri]|uniref:hypothetical protein n=1 Tax=Brevibacillus reuszeri TaxID=54915 RepID=UPI000CCBECEA|nr:hypothetical protein [Brevibacillus reuszeri]